MGLLVISMSFEMMNECLVCEKTVFENEAYVEDLLHGEIIHFTCFGGVREDADIVERRMIVVEAT